MLDTQQIAGKRCSKCGEWKPLEGGFCVDRSKQSGFGSQCKQCSTARIKAWAAANPERSKTAIAAWCKTHPEKRRASEAARKAINPEKFKARSATHYQANRETVLARSAARQKADPKANRAKSARYRNTHRVQVAASRKARPEIRAVEKQRRRDREARVDDGISDVEMRATIRSAFEMSLGICAYCCVRFDDTLTGRPSVDHVVPISKGGRTTPDNLVIACGSCNSKKGNRSIFAMLSL